MEVREGPGGLGEVVHPVFEEMHCRGEEDIIRCGHETREAGGSQGGGTLAQRETGTVLCFLSTIDY